MHEHVGCMIMHAWMLRSAGWLTTWRHDFTEADKTSEYWARNGSCSNICLWNSSFGDAVVWRHIKSIVEGREPYPIHRLVESKTFLIVLPSLDALMLSKLRISHLWSMLFACLFLFVFSSSHFCLDRPFEFSVHRGINSFRCPCFCLNCLCRLSIHRGAHFQLSELIHFYAFHYVFSFLPLTTDRTGERAFL